MLRDKNKFWAIAILTLFTLTLTTTVGDIWETNASRMSVHKEPPSSFLGALLIPSIPGYLVYIVMTGDLHGWRPGPIGQVGRIAVMTLGSWIFWTPIVYLVYIKVRRKRD